MLMSSQMDIPLPLFHKPSAWVFGVVWQHWPEQAGHMMMIQVDFPQLKAIQEVWLQSRRPDSSPKCMHALGGARSCYHEMADGDKSELEETSVAPQINPHVCLCIQM